MSLDEYRPGRFNVEARLENGDGPIFAFNTHMDTVPVGDGWTSDPFVLRAHQGRLYGRGACDCKGPLAAMLEATRLLAAGRDSWRGTLLAVFVGDEEIASEGAKHYAAKHPRIDFAVVGEPTGNAVYSAHKGSLRPRIRVHGVAAHSGTPHLGDNAVLRAAQLLGMVAEAHEREVRRAAIRWSEGQPDRHPHRRRPCRQRAACRLRSAARSPDGPGRGRSRRQERDRRAARGG